MSEEPPGNWELQRSLNKLSNDLKDGLAGINSRLDSMVTTGVYVAEQRRVDDRLKDLADDISAEREARKSEITTVMAQMERTAVWLRWLAAMIVLPIVLFVVNIVISNGGTV